MSAFIYIGAEIGGLFTLSGIFVTAIIGLSLLKSQGNAVMTKIRTDLAQGRARLDLSPIVFHWLLVVF